MSCGMISRQHLTSTWDCSHCANSKQHYQIDSLERRFVEPPDGLTRNEEDNKVADEAECADVKCGSSFVNAFAMLNGPVPEVCHRRAGKYVMENLADEKRYHDSA